MSAISHSSISSRLAPVSNTLVNHMTSQYPSTITDYYISQDTGLTSPVKHVTQNSEHCDQDLSTIPQLDGNISVCSSSYEENKNVVCGPKEKGEVCNGNNEETTGLHNLPSFGVANLRSFLPRVKSVIEKMKNEDINVLLVSEIWEDTNNNIGGEVEKMYETEGLQLVTSGARLSGKRGGGAGIIVDTRYFSVECLDIQVPKSLEVKWALLRPKQSDEVKFQQIIVCSFYYPPKCKKQMQILDHLTSTSHLLLTKFPTAALALGG